tara:strand:+ start:527 stop:1045 length:519 start_codon:yes stop_codon:yes gene_type:complete
MAGSLIKIDEEIVTSAVASVSLTGIDSTYDVYVATFVNVSSVNDNVSMQVRITKGGSADTTSNYDLAFKNLRVETSFSNTGNTNESYLNFGNMGTGTSETQQGTMYLFNFADASEYSFMTVERSNLMADPNYLYGQMGGAVHTVASASDGLQFSIASGDIAGGTFSLYGLKK